MKAEERRKGIVHLLLSAADPVPGSELAGRFGVSRQIIVQDISILKAAGFDIISTHYGYVMHRTPYAERVFKVRHTTEQTADELGRIVRHGGTIVDVFVWHKVYGRVEAKLNICSESDIRQFIEGVRSGKSTELMNITGGYHYHTVRAESEEILDQIEQALTDGNYIVPER